MHTYHVCDLVHVYSRCRYLTTVHMLTSGSTCARQAHTRWILVTGQLSTFRRYVHPVAITETRRGGAGGGAQASRQTGWRIREKGESFWCLPRREVGNSWGKKLHTRIVGILLESLYPQSEEFDTILPQLSSRERERERERQRGREREYIIIFQQRMSNLHKTNLFMILWMQQFLDDKA